MELYEDHEEINAILSRIHPKTSQSNSMAGQQWNVDCFLWFQMGNGVMPATFRVSVTQ